jgi:hypothetical protein
MFLTPCLKVFFPPCVVCCVLPYLWCFLKINQSIKKLCIIHLKCKSHALTLGSGFWFPLEPAPDSACWADHSRGNQQKRGRSWACSTTSARNAGTDSRKVGFRDAGGHAAIASAPVARQARGRTWGPAAGDNNNETHNPTQRFGSLYFPWW